MEDCEPRISMEQTSLSAAGESGLWRVGWTIVNKSPGSLSIKSIQLPHGKFKAERQRFEPPVALDTGGQMEFCTVVHCHEPAGLVTENAFAILNAVWSAEEWRIFVRIRVSIETSGNPETTVESITMQKVGFSRPREEG